MAEISTPVLSTRSETSHVATPRASTLALIRQFARAYSPTLGGYILN